MRKDRPQGACHHLAKDGIHCTFFTMPENKSGYPRPSLMENGRQTSILPNRLCGARGVRPPLDAAAVEKEKGCSGYLNTSEPLAAI